MESLEDVPGYFNQTLTATDYLSSTLPSAHMNKPEMSFHGPPSHLQNSVDVHPFWFEYGRDFHPKERFIDRSQSMDSIPAGLLPGTDTAQEYRNIEIRETMQSLRQQVKDVMNTKIDEVDGEEGISSSPSIDTDNAMTQEERSTMDFFESMLKESLDIDIEDAGGGGMRVNGEGLVGEDSNIPKTARLDMLPSSSDDERTRNWQEPSLTSLLPNNLDRPVVGRVHSVVTEDKRNSPKKGSPIRLVPHHHAQQTRAGSLPNGHTSFLKNNVYLPKESSISSYHRSTQVSPSRKAPPPPTKPKPKRGGNNAGNKRYSYPMGASQQPTEFGANFLIGNRPAGRNYNGNHLHNSPNSSTVSEDMGIVSDLSAKNEQNSPVKNVVYNRFIQYSNHPQNGHPQLHNHQQQRESTSPGKGFRHSTYGENNNAMPYGFNVANGNKNNSNVVAANSGAHGNRRLSDDAISNDSAVDVLKDTSTDDVVLHGIEADLLQLQLTS